MAAWLTLGVTGAAIAHQPPPKNDVLRVVDAGTVDLHTPLRWHGTLHDEPKFPPWGLGLDVELTSVHFAERSVPLRGGLRLSYSGRPGAGELLKFMLATESPRPRKRGCLKFFATKALLTAAPIHAIKVSTSLLRLARQNCWSAPRRRHHRQRVGSCAHAVVCAAKSPACCPARPKKRPAKKIPTAILARCF